jgi:thiol-disulfide isomerase/thioredoxin
MQPVQAPLTLTLLTRTYCHLCDEMRAALAPVAQRYDAAVIEVDVDTNPALEARYGGLVPVLFIGDPQDGRELARYVLDSGRLEAAIADR